MGNKFKIQHGDSADILKRLCSNSFDSLVCDPPAGISFMGKEWDKDKGGRDQWIEWMQSVMRQCYRVLKPGAHGFVWAIDKTAHWTATACENAGFEIKHKVYHLFGSGFPKNRNLWKNDFQKLIEAELGKQDIRDIEWK